MNNYYRLSQIQKEQIAQNLIDIIDHDLTPSTESVTFITNWVATTREEKNKTYLDVWDIVLKNFYPKTRPILFRSINRKSKKEYIGSFTGSVDSAINFSNEKSYWIICETKGILDVAHKYYEKGEYKHTFYPISEVLKKAKENGGWGFSEHFLDKYSGEDEYIMKIDFGHMTLVKYQPL